jgi:hypothetical protein
MRFLCLLLTQLIALQPIWAQTTSAGPSEPDRQATLQLHVVDDPGPAVRYSASGKGYTVRVTDSTGALIAEAAVAFRLPEQTGHFPDGTRALVVYTDARGRASFPAIYWESAGSVELRLTAAKGTSHAGLLIQQKMEPELGAVSTAPIEATAPPVVKPAPPPEPEVLVKTPQPGTVSKPLADIVPMVVSRTSVPMTSNPTSASGAAQGSSREPTVSITNSPTGAGSSRDLHKKWLVLAAVGAGLGLGAVLALKGHSAGGSTTTTSSGVSIGTPTISVGH